MDLMEYKVRELFARYGVPARSGVVIEGLDRLDEQLQDLAYPLVVKAQVPVGGRGKAGGIRFAENLDELRAASQQILGMTIKGHLVQKLLIVEKAEIQKEWYLSILLDRQTKSPMIIFSSIGGMDIENTARQHPEQVLKIPVDPLIGIKDYVPRYLLSRSHLAEQYLPALDSLVNRLCQLFLAVDCTLVEINPLAVLEDGQLLALDGKITVDDSALFRQPDILAYRESLPDDASVLEARRLNFLYIPCETEGNVAVISNGSGMIMSTMDLINKQGLQVGAALDLGGGATSDRIVAAIRIILGNPRIEAVFINIFGGITRCDEVAGGVALAVQNLAGGKLMIVRFEGTNKDRGLEILEPFRNQVATVDGLAEGISKLAAWRDKA